MEIKLNGQNSKAIVHVDSFSGWYVKMPSQFQSMAGRTQLMEISSDLGAISFAVKDYETAKEYFDKLTDAYKNNTDLELEVLNITV